MQGAPSRSRTSDTERIAEHDLAGGVEVALLDLERGNLPGQQLLALGRVVVRVLGVHDVLEALADQLVDRVAGDLAERAVDEQPATVRIEQARRDRSPLEDLLEVVLGAGGERIRLPARGDVENDRHAARDGGALVRPDAELFRRNGPTSTIRQCRCSAVQISRERVSPASAERHSGSISLHTSIGKASPRNCPSRYAGGSPWRSNA